MSVLSDSAWCRWWRGNSGDGGGDHSGGVDGVELGQQPGEGRGGAGGSVGGLDECAVQRADAPAVGAPITEGSEQGNVEEPERGFADQRGCVMAVNAYDLVCANYLVVKRAQPHICQAHRVLLARSHAGGGH
jgi:hypothetical protein